MKLRILLFSIVFASSLGAAPLGTEFTYQGVLSDGGAAADGTYDFRFFVYDADAGGSQVGTVVYVEDLAVTNGRVTTQLDFGSIFNGTALWLEVSVRDGISTGTYTVLSPRQEITAAPFAQHAVSSDVATSAMHATTAGDADSIDGQDGSYYLSWSNFTGIPAGLSDGDDDTLASLSCSVDEIARWNGSQWNCSTDGGIHFVRTFVVGPVGGELPNGTALRNAVNAITPPVSNSQAVLLIVEPGVYNIGTSPLPIWGWMTIEGAGQNLTRITGAVCHATVNSGTIRSTADEIGLRQLTVENYCSDPTGYSVAFDSEGNEATVENATFQSRGSTDINIAVYNSGDALSIKNGILTTSNGTGRNQGLDNSGAGVRLFDLKVDSVESDITWGIRNTGDDFALERGNITVYAGTGDCTAFFNEASGNLLNITDSTLSSLCVDPGASNNGLYLTNSSAKLNDVKVNAEASITLLNSSSHRSIRMNNVTTWASMSGVWCHDQGGNGISLYIDHSRLSGGDNAAYNHLDTCSVRIGSSKLDGGVLGAASCVGVYDQSYAAYTCP